MLKKILLCFFVLTNALRGSITDNDLAAWNHVQKRVNFKETPDNIQIIINDVHNIEKHNWNGALTGDSFVVNRGSQELNFRLFVDKRPEGFYSLASRDKAVYVDVKTQALFGIKAPEKNEPLVCYLIKRPVNLASATVSGKDNMVTVTIPFTK